MVSQQSIDRSIWKESNKRTRSKWSKERNQVDDWEIWRKGGNGRRIRYRIGNRVVDGFGHLQGGTIRVGVCRVVGEGGEGREREGDRRDEGIYWERDSRRPICLPPLTFSWSALLSWRKKEEEEEREWGWNETLRLYTCKIHCVVNYGVGIENSLFVWGIKMTRGD